MPRPRMTKAERAIVMINRGASTAAVVKTLGVSPQYVYSVRSRMNKGKNKGTVITSPAPETPTRQQKEHIQAHIEAINSPNRASQDLADRQASIMGEYARRQQMTTWQRIKAALGF